MALGRPAQVAAGGRTHLPGATSYMPQWVCPARGRCGTGRQCPDQSRQCAAIVIKHPCLPLGERAVFARCWELVSTPGPTNEWPTFRVRHRSGSFTTHRCRQMICLVLPAFIHRASQHLQSNEPYASTRLLARVPFQGARSGFPLVAWRHRLLGDGDGRDTSEVR